GRIFTAPPKRRDWLGVRPSSGPEDGRSRPRNGTGREESAQWSMRNLLRPRTGALRSSRGVWWYGAQPEVGREMEIASERRLRYRRDMKRGPGIVRCPEAGSNGNPFPAAGSARV